jgi:hypothetical protein
VQDFTGESKAGYKIVYMIVPICATLRALQISWCGEKATNYQVQDECHEGSELRKDEKNQKDLTRMA